MEINKEELQTMMREFWAVNNNETCEAMSVIFLHGIGLSDAEIKHWLELEDMLKITQEDKKNYNEALQSTKDYFILEEGREKRT